MKSSLNVTMTYKNKETITSVYSIPLFSMEEIVSESNSLCPLSPMERKPINNCLIENHNNMTLWSIASIYKTRWKTNIYAAMLGIFETNKDKFQNKNIGIMLKNSKLKCPTKKLLSSYQDKKTAKEIFQLLIGKN
ncbi:hypothetical protein JK628_20785 [Shewanella sp. KX20019]|uniref:hypothetical protein n=1 Tax=Shewanella sp. KX20019 TaxID=2803864 RepID=UPI001925E102|nr:hypothetical protein [Shewanella sp. KX20019]QQX79907.1 hypothetical protein JK628_20785 [Shewanella sp. KX20019]